MKDSSSTGHAKKFRKDKVKSTKKGPAKSISDLAKSKSTDAKPNGKKPFDAKQKGRRPKSNGENFVPAPAKKSKKESYQQIKERKMVMVTDLKTNWNHARPKAAAESRADLILKMLSKIKGQVHLVALRHDTSRVVQTILQFGTDTQRKVVLAELIPKVLDIAKTPYGHFTVLKAISYCDDKDDQKRLAAALSGHFVSLGTNVIGARTVETVLQLYSPTITRALKAEFYGKKYSILTESPPKDLSELIQQNPSKKEAILDHMRDLVHKLTEKGLLVFSYVHSIIYEYTKEVALLPGRMDELVKLLCDSSPKLVTTKPGSKTCCILASHSGAKERKRMLKALKGGAVGSLTHASAHLVFMRLIDVTDDTVNVQKSLLEELRRVAVVEKYSPSGELIGKPYPALITVAKDRFGKKFLLRLLSPSKTHLEPDEEALFGPSATSKKSDAARRQEHLAYMKAPLLNVCRRFATDLITCKDGSKVLAEIAKVFYPTKLLSGLAALFAEKMMEIDDDQDDFEVDETDGLDADEEINEDKVTRDEGMDVDDEKSIEEDAGKSLWDDEDSGSSRKDRKLSADTPQTPELAIHENAVAHALLKQIVQFEASDEAADSTFWEVPHKMNTFTSTLIELLHQDKQRLELWLSCNRSCFALVEMMKVKSEQARLLALITPSLKKSCSESFAGGKVLIELVASLSDLLVTPESVGGKSCTKKSKKMVGK